MASRAPLRVIPLGGLGEFGLNCMVLERGDEAIAIDCGVMFPEDHMMGIDLVIPDLSYLRSLGDRFKGFVFTHGHEDHIGALPYVWGDFDVPVFATRFTAGLINERLADKAGGRSGRLEIYGDGDRFDVAGFNVEALPVTHSIVDACSLAIRTAGETVIHTGDFKIDPTPIDGREFASKRFREIGDEGVKLLLSDSTNIENQGTSGSERLVRGWLEPMFAATRGRVFVTTFASHIHRVAAVISLAQQFGRKLAILGRRMESNAALATETGHLQFPPGLLIDTREASRMPPGKVCYMVTGSQGEPRSGLTRLAFLEMRDVTPGPGDAVIFSSKIIPGNDRAVGAIVNQLYRVGCDVYYPRMSQAHVSGHAYREEQRTMIELVRPEFFVPVHGEYRNLLHHAQLAAASGVAQENCIRLLDGDVLEIDARGARKNGVVAAGRLLIDGDVIGSLDEAVIRDRRNISKDGMVMVVLGVARQSGKIVSGPEFVMRGVAGNEAEPIDEVALGRAVAGAVESMARDAVSDREELQEEVRLAVRRYFRRVRGSRPVVVPYVMEL